MAILDSSQIPQADSLERVKATVQAVAAGARTDEDICSELDMVDRQGRYYRIATEILGLTERTGQNNSNLTDLGQGFVASNQKRKNEILKQAILSTPIFSSIVPYIESHDGVGKKDLVQFIRDLSNFAPRSDTPRRRVMTIISWLQELDIIFIEEDLYHFNYEDIDSISFTDVSTQIIPRQFELNEYTEPRERVQGASEDITFQVDAVKRERANAAHEALVELAVQAIRKSQAIPRKNQLIDLATKDYDEVFIFEMKSITDDNARAQIRKGVSQLYEYRYLYDNMEAKLVLVIETELGGKYVWLQDYLEKDRGIYLVWRNGNEFDASADTKRDVYVLF